MTIITNIKKTAASAISKLGKERVGLAILYGAFFLTMALIYVYAFNNVK